MLGSATGTLKMFGSSVAGEKSQAVKPARSDLTSWDVLTGHLRLETLKKGAPVATQHQ